MAGTYSIFGRPVGFQSGVLDEFQRLERDIDELLGSWSAPSGIRSVAPGSYPPINIGTTADRVDVYLFAAGVDPKSLDISIQKNLLTVSGERKASVEKNVDYYRRERFEGQFRRVITLPEDVDPDRVEASYRDGILQIQVQRSESARPRQITVS